ncbi:sensor histidine kinase [Pseudotenacibaculum haliotis]|uniref:Sensor histidine kinase n=1 Tax=Pseudotenacibaculum haliotis TaxID=1862138 RepID=A0ABW5LNS4_9FLAO
MKTSLLRILILLCFIISCSQPEEPLQLKIQKIAELQKKAKFPINPRSFDYLKSADSIIATSKNLPDSVIIENIFSRGFCYRMNGELDSAKVHLHKAIDLIDSSNVRKRDIIYHRHSWETDLALEDYGDVVSSANKFIALLDRTKNYGDLRYAYNALERVNLSLTNYEKALLYNDSVQTVSTKISDRSLSNITSFSKARILFKLNKVAKVFQLMDSLSNTLEGNDVKRQFYRDYGALLYQISNYKTSVENFKKSLSYLKKIPQTEIEDKDTELLQAYLNITEAYTNLRNFELGTKYLDSAKTYINSNTSVENSSFAGELRLKLGILNSAKIDNIMTDYYALVRNLNKAHEEKIEEELYTLKLANKKEKQLLTENKEKEISNLKLKSWFLFVLILAVLLVIIGLLFYRQKRLRYEKNDLLLQQRLLRSQMNPHFTFNALYAIKNQIATDSKTATDYLLRFSRLLRLILENSVQNFVALEDELELLDKYMELQLLRFPEKFDYEISLENMERDELIFIPPMLLQPFIENSIEHGFNGIDYKGQILIKLKKLDKIISCTIIDNGIGISESSTQNKTSTSTRLISDFVLKTTKTHIKINNRNDKNPNETGVVVEFLIPYKLTEYD